MNTSQDSQPTSGATVAGRSMAWRIKAIIGGSIGNLIEWYDWYIYSAFSLYFASVFFPTGNQTAQLLNAAAIFSVGFFMRPLGSWLMGVYADRRGRRAALVLSMGAMGGASLLVAVTPGYESIGLFAPLLLVLARVVQGLSIGGEYAAVATYLSEIAGKNRRGFYTSFQYVTLIGGQLLALVVVVSLQSLMSAEELTAWGWRIPFVIGAIGAVAAFFICLSLEETTSFENMKKREKPVETWHLMRTHPKELMFVLALTMGGGLGFYVFSNYMQKFLVNTSGFSKDTASLIMTLAMIVFAIMQPVMGWISDHVGRKPLLIFFGLGATIFTVPVMNFLASTQDAIAAFFVIVFALVIQSAYTSISGLYKAELFPTEIRALGVGLPYAIGIAAVGGTSEVVALKLKQMGHEPYFYWYVTFFMVIVLIAAVIMKDTKHHSRILED